MKLEYVDYRNLSEVTTSVGLSALENLCTDPALLEKIKYTATLMEQLAEDNSGRFLVAVSEYHNLIISVQFTGIALWKLLDFISLHPEMAWKPYITSDLDERDIPVVNIQIFYALKGNPIY